MPFDKQHAEAVWDGPDFGEAEKGEKACPDEYRSRVGAGGWMGTSKNVEEWEEAKRNGPDIHADIVRLGVVKTSQDVRHGKEPEEDGECPRGCEDVSDRRGLLEDDEVLP